MPDTSSPPLRPILPSLEDDPLGSVTRWLMQVRAGDQSGVENLCNRYFYRLSKLARAKIGSSNRAVSDEEDIANTVLDTLFRNVANGDYPNLLDRDGLWALLLTITNAKVISLRRSVDCERRGGARVVHLSQLDSTESDQGGVDFIGDEPTPEMLIAIKDSCAVLLQRLDDINREVAIRKLNGASNRTIATELGITTKSVARKVELIQSIWGREFKVPE